MSFKEIIKYEGKVYDLVFLNTDSALSNNDRLEVCIGAIELEHNDKDHKRIKGEGFEGEVRRTGQSSFSCFYGNTYEAKLDTDHGQRNVDMMITGKR